MTQSIYFLFILLITTTSLYNFFIKLSSDLINPFLGALILAATAFVISLSMFIYNKYSINTEAILITQKGVYYSLLAGISIALFEVLLFYTFSKGISLSVLSPIVISGSVIFTFALGIFLFKESLDFKSIMAILLIGAGSYLLIKG